MHTSEHFSSGLFSPLALVAPAAVLLLAGAAMQHAEAQSQRELRRSAPSSSMQRSPSQSGTGPASPGTDVPGWAQSGPRPPGASPNTGQPSASPSTQGPNMPSNPDRVPVGGGLGGLLAVGLGYGAYRLRRRTG